MVNTDDLILSELEKLVVAVDPAVPNWRDVIARAGPTRRVLPRVLVLALVAALLIGPTLAFSAGVRNFLGLSSSPQPVLAKAVLQVSAPAPHRQIVRLFVAPSDKGGTCEFTDIVPSGSALGAVGGGGGTCAGRGAHIHPSGSAAPLTWTMSMGHKPTGPALATWVPVVFSGWVNPRLQAARVELVWRRGHLRLAFEHDHFLAAPAALRNPAFVDLPFSVVVYNHAGQAVAHQRLPESLLYFEWKRDHVAKKLHAWRVSHP
jgi:hypothetical protein